MRILFGVQATGNGHISRSREIVRCLKADGHTVNVILSGRDPSLLWDMEVFEPYVAFKGLTFSVKRGKVSILQTASRLDFFRFYADIRGFDARGFDLVITDFEPVSARIAKRHRLPSIGIGHQYAFCYKVPVSGFNPAAWYVIRNFAPARHAVGLHWHHFNQPILPPIVPGTLPAANGEDPGKVLVYLPFETIDDIRVLCEPFDSHRFFIYHQLSHPSDEGHLRLRGFSRDGFLKDLVESSAVITNAGFELVSEALVLGKKILVKPLAGQMEQLSNAKALSDLNLGRVMRRLDRDSVGAFLAGPPSRAARIPDVARMIADWIGAGAWDDVSGLSRAAWAQTVLH